MKQFLTRRWFPGISLLRMPTTILVGTGIVTLAVAFAPVLTWGGPPPGPTEQEEKFPPSHNPSIVDSLHPTKRFELVYPVVQLIDGFPRSDYAAVKDNETGLVWELAPGDLNGDGTVDVSAESEDRVTWQGAIQSCNFKTTGGKDGWQLPWVYQIQSLFDLHNPDPVTKALPLGHPFRNIISGVLLTGYWTVTPTIGQPGFVKIISFPNGVPASVSKGGALLTWCVRSPN